MPPAASGQDMEGAGLGEQPLSRQVFIVQELEVRDRLASSQINKFLYLYTSESMPRRAHSNMVSGAGDTGLFFNFWFLKEPINVNSTDPLNE